MNGRARHPVTLTARQEAEPPAAMGPEQAAWIRDNAWVGAMRKTYGEVPGYYEHCACEYGLSGWCEAGQCGRCAGGDFRASPQTYICRRRPVDVPAHFREPYEHPSTLESITPRRCTIAAGWLADRTCRWQCPHECHLLGPAGQLELFEAVR
jgi:hypothetical protein